MSNEGNGISGMQGGIDGVFQSNNIPIGKGRRLSAALIDLALIPFALGLLLGFLLISVPQEAKYIIMVVVNIVWMMLKDLLWQGAAPGKRLLGLKVISIETGAKITIPQAFIRNLLLFIPLVFLVGYPIEIIMILAKGERLGDILAKTKVVKA
jgi:uncharacterized RDD family membrane protein YckC